MKKSVSLILALTLLLAFALTGCRNSENSPKDNQTENVSDPKTSDGYKPVAGAASEYELYTTVVNYLNNGFHKSDLQNVRDPILTYAFRSKMEEKPEEIMTLGLKWKESCDLISRLIHVAETMEYLLESDGQVDMDYVDFTPFIREFPAEMQPKLNEDNRYFYRFIESLIYLVTHPEENDRNPYRTDQKTWELLSASEFSKLGKVEYDGYHDWDKDLFNNFPRIYMLDLGEYRQDSEIYIMKGYYAEIDGRYYFVDFAVTVGSVGG